MIKFKTNLDYAKRYLDASVRDAALVGTLQVGDNVRFWVPSHRIKRNGYFELRIVARTYDMEANRLEIELHLPSHFESIKQWEEWFKNNFDV